jgi:hypothetical protein
MSASSPDPINYPDAVIRPREPPYVPRYGGGTVSLSRDPRSPDYQPSPYDAFFETIHPVPPGGYPPLPAGWPFQGEDETSP